MTGDGPQPGFRRAACALSTLLVMDIAVPVTMAEPPPAKTEVSVTYTRDVKPILDEYCVDCHGGWFPKASLSLDSLEGIHEGGRSGPAIVPGEPAKGWLPHSLSLDVGRRGKMPPGKQRLSEEETGLIKSWIEQGAR